MNKKTLNAHDRLIELFKGTKRLGGLQVGKRTVKEFKDADPEILSDGSVMNWEDRSIRETYANAVLRLTSTRFDRPLQEAFKASGRDPNMSVVR